MLEAAGLLGAEADHKEFAACCDTDGGCSHDGCNLVETGLIKIASSSLKVPAPDLSACLCFLCVQLSLPDTLTAPISRVSAAEQPIDWLPTWQFVRRAAPLAQAPSLLG